MQFVTVAGEKNTRLESNPKAPTNQWKCSVFVVDKKRRPVNRIYFGLFNLGYDII
jgi:hypothetical protein